MDRIAIYCTKTNRLIDLATGDGSKAIDRLAPTYGGALVAMPLDEAIERQENSFRTKVFEITEEQWTDALEVLPPVSWRHTAEGQSFKMSERTCGMITAIYVEIGGRYFSFSDTITLPHAECCRRVRNHIADEALDDFNYVGSRHHY